MKLHERHAVNFFALESMWGVLHFLSLLETLCKSVSPWSAFPVREGVFLSKRGGFWSYSFTV